MRVEVKFYFDAEGPARSFAELRDFLGRLADVGIESQVETIPVQEEEPPAAKPVSQAKRRAASKVVPDKPNGGPVDLTDQADQADDDEDPLGLGPPDTAAPSAQEAKDNALKLIGELWRANHKPQVKALQQTMGVAKFTDVPEADAHRLYKLTLQLAEQVGHRV